MNLPGRPRRAGRVRRIRRTLLLGLVGWLAMPGVAAADPPAPTDYRSTVDSIEPPVEGLEVDIVGGDSFVQLTAGGHDVVVLGYQGEPYLWFRPEGEVLENTLSPAVELNRSRYGTVEDGTGDPDADPAWRTVAEGGTFAWHDHRTHWMATQPPLGSRRGDVILEGVLPLLVDGTPVDVSVSSRWEPAPSPTVPILGVVVGATIVVVTWLAARRSVSPVVVAGLAVMSAAALAVGWWQTASLPAVTGPPRTAWLLPLVAVASAIAAALVTGDDLRGRIRTALVALAAAELGLWCWLRRDGLTRAILPTDAPAWFDRLVTAAAGGTAVAVLIVLVVDQLRPRRPAPGG